MQSPSKEYINSNQKIVLKPIKWVNGGYTLAHHENFTCFIKGSIPEELVECEIEYQKGKNLFLKVVNVLEKNSSRKVSDCEIFLNCGGCDFRHLNYSDELVLKKKLILDELKFHKIDFNENEIQLFSKEENYYRNNVQFKVLSGNKGFFKNNTNEFIPIPESGCKTIPEKLNQFEVPKNYSAKELKLRILNDKVYNYEIEEQKLNIKNKTFFIPKKGFFQINSGLMEIWLDQILTKVKNFDSVLELFSGMGFISIFLAEQNKKVFSFELENSSVEVAKKNILVNKISNISAFQKNIFKDKISEKYLKSEVYFLNPARNGSGKKILEEILKYKPIKIFYSSCNYITLVQDLKLISKFYKITDLEIFDFFPRTSYFESFVCLELNF